MYTDVYEFYYHNSDWMLPCKGTTTMMSHYRLSIINKAGSKATGMTLVLVDGGKYKDLIGEGGEPEAVLPLSKLAQLLDDWEKKPKPGSAGGGESIVFSPVFNFYGGTPSREEAIEAGRVSFAEFKRLYRRMKDEERRKQFSPA